MKILKVIFFFLLAIFAITLALSFSAAAAGTIIGMVVGTIGAVIGFLFKILGIGLRLVFHPIMLVIIIGFLLFGRKRSSWRE